MVDENLYCRRLRELRAELADIFVGFETDIYYSTGETNAHYKIAEILYKDFVFCPYCGFRLAGKYAGHFCGITD